AALAAVADICEVEEISLPDLPYAAVCWAIMLAEAASAFEDLIDSGQVAELIAPENRIGGFVADLIPARSYVRALRVRRLIRQELAALTSAYDAIVTPTVGAVAPPLGVRFSEYYGQWG